MNFTVLWFILIALALIAAFLLLAPVKFRLQYRGEFLFSARYFVFSYRSDKIVEKIKGKNEKGSISKTVNAARKASEEGEMGIVSFFAEVTKIIVKLSKRLLSHAIVDKLYFKLEIASQDAAQTAVDYGAACAVVYPALGTLTGLMRVRKYEVDIRPDFYAGETKGEFDFIFRVRFVFALFAIAAAIIRVVRFSAASKAKADVRSI